MAYYLGRSRVGEALGSCLGDKVDPWSRDMGWVLPRPGLWVGSCLEG